MVGFHGIAGAGEITGSCLEVGVSWFTLTDGSVGGEQGGRRVG